MSRVTLLAALLLSACTTVGPDYVAPNTAPATLVNARGPMFSNAAVETAWWRQYGDPQLDALVAAALADNTDVRVALGRVTEARALLAEVRRQRLPSLAPSVGATYSDQQNPGFGSGDRVSSEAYTGGFDASWEPDLFGRLRRGREAARADLAAETELARDAQVTVAAEVARVYFELRGAQARLAVARRNLASQSETLRITRVRFEEGAAGAFDVARTTALTEATRATLPTLVEAERTQALRLELLTGRRPGSAPELLRPRATPAIARALPLGDAAALLGRRPDVRAAERRLAASNARVGVATAERLPRLSLAGFLGFLTGDLFSLGSNALAISAGPTASLPNLLGDTRARLRGAEARRDQATATYDGAVLAALEDVERSLVAYGQERDRFAALQNQAAQSRRAADLARIRYLEGASGLLEVLEAEREQLAAEDGLAASQARVNVGVTGVYRALGGGWEAAQ